MQFNDDLPTCSTMGYVWWLRKSKPKGFFKT